MDFFDVLLAKKLSGSGGGGGSTTDLIDKYADGSISGAIVLTTSSIRADAFKDCKYITSVDAPNVAKISGGAFSGCSALVSISFPSANTVNATQQFLSCANLVNVNLPSLQTAGANMFQGCTSLTFIDLPKLGSITTRLFHGCTSLQTIILRNNSVLALGNLDCLYNTPFRGYNGLTGTLYVPSSLVNSYKTASNWSSLFNDGTMSILSIEGSIYE